MIEDFFTYEFIVMEKLAAQQDSVGGDASGYSEVTDSNFMGYIGRPKPSERMSGGIETIYKHNILTYPVSVTLTEKNQVKVISGLDYVGEVFNVVPIKNVHNHHKKAELIKP